MNLFKKGGIIKLIIWILFIIFLPTVCFAETAKDAIRALKKLEAKVQTGISFRDYSPAISDAKFEVNLYNETDENNNNPELQKAINSSMSHFEFARYVWASKFEYRPATETLGPRGRVGTVIMNAYPGANKPLSEGGVLTLQTYNGFFSKTEEYIFFIDDALKYIWNEAHKSLTTATNLLKTSSQLP